MPKFNLNPIKGITLKAPYAKKRIQRNKVRKTVGIDLTDSSVKVTFDKSNFEMALNMTGPNGVMEVYGLNSTDIVTLASAKQAPSGKNFNLSRTLWSTSNRRQLGDPIEIITDSFNAKYVAEMKFLGHVGRYVTYLYSSKSRVVRGTENLIAVKLSDGSKGWMTRDGRFIGQDSIYQLMQGLDGTVASGLYDFSFADMWERMSAQQRADFVDATRDVDWDAFWEVKYSRDNPLGDKWLDAFDNVAEALLNVVG